VFRNAMLIVIAGFPGAFIAAFFSGSLLIENIFSLDGLGLLGWRSVLDRDYPVVFANLYIFSLLGLVVQPDLGPDLPGSTRASISRRGRLSDVGCHRRRAPCQTPMAFSAQPAPLGEFSEANRRGYWSLWIFLVLFVLSLFAEFIANDKPCSLLQGRASGSGRWSITRKKSSAAFWL
jgi:hypothetical protein